VKASAESIINDHLQPGDEYILVNDGSTDDTANILHEIAAMHPAVRIITHPTNRGGAATRNTALAAAQNALCFCLDSDNLLLPGSIKALRTRMMNSGADIVAFQETSFFTDESGPNAPTHSHVLENITYDFTKYLSTTRVPGSGGNHLFTKACWEAIGGYPEDTKALDTWGFGLRLAGAGFKTCVAPGTAYLHRYSHESYWNRHVQTGTVNRDAYELLRPYLNQIHPADVRYLASAKGQAQWFTGLDKRPIRTRRTPCDAGFETPIVYVKKSLKWVRNKIASPSKAA